MFKLINSRDIMPKSLFITGITTDTDPGDISTVDIGHSIFRGGYRREQVALRVLCTIHDNVDAFLFPSPITLILLERIYSKKASIWRRSNGDHSHTILFYLYGEYSKKIHIHFSFLRSRCTEQ